MTFAGKSIRFKWLYMIGYAAIIGIMAVVFLRIPGSFLPEEDQGIMFTLVQLPAGSTLDETQDVLDKVRNYYDTQETDNIASVFTIAAGTEALREFEDTACAPKRTMT